MDIDTISWYRPPSGAVGRNGDVSSEHYAWLAYEWDNLYVICHRCSRARGRRFPVQRYRVRIGTYGALLAAERPLLLDPCADDPDEHLVFLDNGQVAAESVRGQYTIETFDLNDTKLIRLAVKRSWRHNISGGVLASTSPWTRGHHTRGRAGRRFGGWLWLVAS